MGARGPIVAGLLLVKFTTDLLQILAILQLLNITIFLHCCNLHCPVIVIRLFGRSFKDGEMFKSTLIYFKNTDKMQSYCL